MDAILPTSTIPVTADIAQRYNSISDNKQRKIQAMMRVWLQELEHAETDVLDTIMDTISDRAAERGLTPEILDELLADES